MKINANKLIALLAAIYPIIPYYFEIAGISATNIFAFLFVLAGVLILRERIFIGKIYTNGYCIAVELWIFAYIISMIANSAFSECLWFTLRVAAVIIVFVRLVNTKERFVLVLDVMIATSGVLCVFGIIEEITHFNIFELLNTSGVLNYNPLRFGLLRILSFSSHTIAYGMYLMFCMSLCFYRVNIKDTARKRRYYFVYALLWINMILTLSRSIIICALISQFMLLYFCGFRVLLKSTLLITAFAIAAFMILRLVFPELAKIAENYIFMILAVFESNYQSQISSAFGNDNLNAIGNRLDLYRWVVESMEYRLAFGYGPQAKFAYKYINTDGQYFWSQTKTSIEVQNLAVLYRYGLVGMISEIGVFISVLVKSLRDRDRSAEWENKLNFNSVCFSTFLMYFVVLFAVNSSSERTLFYLLVALFITYNINKKFSMAS